MRIFARPFTDGALTPNYSAHRLAAVSDIRYWHRRRLFHDHKRAGGGRPDPLPDVDDANQTTLLFETFIPVHYLFGDPAHIVTDIDLNVDTPDVLKFNENVNISFNYSTRQAGGVRIFARPFTNGALTPNYAAHASPLYPTGSGNGTGSFTITSGQVVVDQIRIQMWDANQTTLLFEAFLPVYYRFRSATNSVTRYRIQPGYAQCLQVQPECQPDL